MPKFMSVVSPPNCETVEEYIRWGAENFERSAVFFGHGTDNAWDEAAWLVLWALGLSWEQYESALALPVAEVDEKRIRELFRERVERRVPAAYLTGEAHFAGLSFKVNESVLVPRSPFAELIERGFQPWLREEPESILDMCTGSGCIGIACAHKFDAARVDLVDVSAPALELARQNCQDLGVSSRVRVIESDLFDALAGNRYDLIVSNPPYVGECEYAALPPEYLAEPQLGLLSGEDGLALTRALLARAAQFLTPKGLLFVEVGYSQDALESAFAQVPFTWLEFENGGSGIFLLSRDQLEEYF